jgi:hypothetical protein
MEHIQQQAIAALLARESGRDGPVIRVYWRNEETGTHQIIFQDRLVQWDYRIEPAEWSLDLQTGEYRFLCDPTNVAELKVRLIPGTEIWLRTEDNETVVEVFRWESQYPGEEFTPFMGEQWVLNNPPNRFSAEH